MHMLFVVLFTIAKTEDQLRELVTNKRVKKCEIINIME